MVPNHWTLVSFAQHTGTSLFEGIELPKEKGTDAIVIPMVHCHCHHYISMWSQNSIVCLGSML
jgi:hypothetical protein